ncbi:serine/threonine-protein kinase Sgk3 isoform X10 [Myotis myotis]|uniref:serine/threonine-protein kinase Sgk3 isoform X10 n=1 Tax=Myotis myotis TaxID=51298 RepID=UPI00174ECD37|nr:serine/threonine-protein kinase Sgk3 isoform X10 [Myotis myotis]
MDYKESCPSVSIPSSDEHREKKKRFTVYKVLVSVGRSEWFVFRRYAEFDKLYNTLKKQFPTMALKIPAKRIFGDNFDPDFIKQRRAGLNEFIQNLVRHPELYNHPDVRAFLQMDSPKHQSDPSEDEDERSTEKLHSTSQNINLGPSGNPQILRFPHPFGPLKHAKPTDFDFLKVIGKGSFGKVLLAKRKLDGKFYAVKVLQKKIVLNRRELFFHLQRERSFPEHRARFYAAEIASALGYLHSIKIVYRDLKPENILLDSVGHVVLTDFGLCKEGIAISDTTTTFCGTPEYLAPEVIRKQPYDNTVDWWCLGAVLYEMLYGLSTPIMPQYLGRSMIFRSSSFQPPFYCRDVAEMYDNILHKPLNLRPGVSLTAWSILEELLEKDRQNRLGAKEDFYLRQKCQLCFTYEETMIVKRIKCAMCTQLEIQNHPFFESLSWTDLVQKKIPPPFNPNVAGPDDIRNFDAAFTEETVPYSVCVSTDYSIVNASVLEADDAFVGFSYAPPSEDLFL